MTTLFIGPSGSGKDTQSKLLEKNFDFKMISTGDLLRDKAKEESVLGKKIKDLLSQGKFIPTEITYQVLSESIQQFNTSNIVLNGVVRDEDQIELLDSLLNKLDRNLDSVFYFKLEESTAIERLLDRSREDDGEEEIKNRLGWFKEKVQKILDTYKQRDILYTIDASKEINQIHSEISAKLGLE